eukprot:Skav226718  [mRNA]  locus=scaffold3813:9812:20038:- [translate_table: standard]
MVLPAVAPLPYEFAVSLHLVHIIFGLFGAAFVLVSGFDTAGRTALTKGTSMMLVFMATITWTWWINRQGTLYWNLDPGVAFWDIRCSAEKRNRTVHILKNFSIVGALTILQQLAKYESQETKQTRRGWRALVSRRADHSLELKSLELIQNGTPGDLAAQLELLPKEVQGLATQAEAHVAKTEYHNEVKLQHHLKGKGPGKRTYPPATGKEPKGGGKSWDKKGPKDRKGESSQQTKVVQVGT